MFRPLLRSILALGLLALVSTGSYAGGPNPNLSTTPGFIRLVGATGGAPDATAGQFTVVARDPANNPVNGASIVLDLSNCTDLAVCSDQMDANALVNCAAKTVRKFTNALGMVTFTVLGRGTGAGNAASLAHSARIYGNGTLLGSPSVSAFDLDGSGGVGAGDLSVWFGDFGSGVPYERSDFDGSGTIGADDLSEWLGVFGVGGSTQSCAASCP